MIFGIVPVFAFANAGVSLSGLSWDALPAQVALGIATGLLVGKTIGVFGASWLVVKGGLCRLPPGIAWPTVLGMALLCGVGFTMSLFIGTLAFEQQGLAFSAAVRIGVPGGSRVSAVLGFTLLKWCLRTSRPI